MDHWQAQAFGKLPKPMMPPRRAFQRLQAGDAELLPLRKMAGRTVGVGVIPYPPGIPIVMPGENVGPEDGPLARLPAHAPGVGRGVPALREGARGLADAGRRVPHLVPALRAA
jgi:arginine decarboxylase